MTAWNVDEKLIEFSIQEINGKVKVTDKSEEIGVTWLIQIAVAHTFA